MVFPDQATGAYISKPSKSPQYPSYVEPNPIITVGAPDYTGQFRLVIKTRAEGFAAWTEDSNTLAEFLANPPIAAITLWASNDHSENSIGCTVYSKHGLKVKDLMDVVKDVQDWGAASVYATLRKHSASRPRVLYDW